MVIRIRKIEAGKLIVTKLYFGAEKREVILILP
jgi:hypothetical protein